nr:prepro-GNCP-1 [Cavia cutleri]
MRTVPLFAACLLLTLMAQAEPLPRAADHSDTKMKGDREDHVAVISFWEEESTSLEDAGAGAGRACICTTRTCRFPYRRLGTCIFQNRVYTFCC